MPQLDPAIWFPILIFSWILFTVAIPHKVATLASPNTPKDPNTEEANVPPSQHPSPAPLQPWNWPWH
uniref:ATPase subunit 8 n=1 Tax=Gonorynchus greyi TaxID=149986 RepID=Q85DW7_9TELE|nr:ATP synthase F0 subunit 8 [Gonorynchus greyi]BAC67524.1 ATPase subunit 8 [Gonorynchus greyi]